MQLIHQLQRQKSVVTVEQQASGRVEPEPLARNGDTVGGGETVMSRDSGPKERSAGWRLCGGSHGLREVGRGDPL